MQGRVGVNRSHGAGEYTSANRLRNIAGSAVAHEALGR